MKRYASIDIGTNTILMAVADIAEDGSIIPVYDDQQLPRLGKDVDANRYIPGTSVDRVIKALNYFREKAESLNAEKIFACGTSALRDAKNREEIIQRIKSKTNIDVEIISGKTEAEYTYYGAVTGQINPKGYIGVLDIGGGSTELVTGNGLSVGKIWSLDIGCVRLTERFFSSLPPSEKAIHQATKNIRDALTEIEINPKIDKLIGVAGTVTTLASIAAGLKVFSPDVIEGYELSKDKTIYLQQKYSKLTLHEMQNIPQISRGREDILLAGIFILNAYLNLFGLDSIFVSTRGLRYGQLLAKTAK